MSNLTALAKKPKTAGGFISPDGQTHEFSPYRAELHYELAHRLGFGNKESDFDWEGSLQAVDNGYVKYTHLAKQINLELSHTSSTAKRNAAGFLRDRHNGQHIEIIWRNHPEQNRMGGYKRENHATRETALRALGGVDATTTPDSNLRGDMRTRLLAKAGIYDAYEHMIQAVLQEKEEAIDTEQIARELDEVATGHGYQAWNLYLKEPSTPHFHRFKHSETGTVFKFTHGLRHPYWFLSLPDQYVYSGIGLESAKRKLQQLHRPKRSGNN